MKRPTDHRPFALSPNTTCCLALPRSSVVLDPWIPVNDPAPRRQPHEQIPTDTFHQHPVAAGNVAPRIGDRFDPGLFELVPELDDLRVLISPLAPESQTSSSVNFHGSNLLEAAAVLEPACDHQEAEARCTNPVAK
jgi:hypothetical protein